MTEIKTTNVDTKLPPQFLTIMHNVINVIHQKRDEDTDEFMGDEEEDEEEETTEQKPVVVANNSRTATLGPRKVDPKDIIVPKYRAKADEIILKPTIKKKSVLDYNSSDSEDTMRSKIPLKLDIDQNTISKLKQRIMVWADQQPGYEVKDVPVKLLLIIPGTLAKGLAGAHFGEEDQMKLKNETVG